MCFAGTFSLWPRSYRMAAQVLDWAFGPRVGHGTVEMLINVFTDNNVTLVRRWRHADHRNALASLDWRTSLAGSLPHHLRLDSLTAWPTSRCERGGMRAASKGVGPFCLRRRRGPRHSGAQPSPGLRLALGRSRGAGLHFGGCLATGRIGALRVRSAANRADGDAKPGGSWSRQPPGRPAGGWS